MRANVLRQSTHNLCLTRRSIESAQNKSELHDWLEQTFEETESFHDQQKEGRKAAVTTAVFPREEHLILILILIIFVKLAVKRQNSK